MGPERLINTCTGVDVVIVPAAVNYIIAGMGVHVVCPITRFDVVILGKFFVTANVVAVVGSWDYIVVRKIMSHTPHRRGREGASSGVFLLWESGLRCPPLQSGRSAGRVLHPD
jgi:hypothetical protein